MFSNRYKSSLLFLLLLPFAQPHQVIFALNVGGDTHIDSNGIEYHKDNSNQGSQYVCDKHTQVTGALATDQYIYKSIRHNFRNYVLPVQGDGEYLLILKFMQCTKIKPGERILDVLLNEQHRILTQLDVVQAVGIGVALEKYVQFDVCDGVMRYQYESSAVVNSLIRLAFVVVKKAVSLSGIALLKGNRSSISELIWPVDENEYFPPFHCRSTSNSDGEKKQIILPQNVFHLYFNSSINVIVNVGNKTTNTEL
jgi:hypothetical protein